MRGSLTTHGGIAAVPAYAILGSMPHDSVHHTAVVRRLRPLFFASFFQGFILWYGIEKLFMRSIGFTDALVADETVILTIVMILANVPLGILADRWSRKGVLSLASLSLIANTVICGASHGFWLYVLGSCFWGLFAACYNGTYDSVVYDCLSEELGDTSTFEHFYGRIQLYDSAALVAGSLLSALAVHVMSLRGVYFATIPFVAASFVALAVFREPTLHRQNSERLVRAHIAATFRAIFRQREIFWIAGTLVAIGITMRIMFEFDQLWLLALAVPAVWYGPINALLLSSIGASGMLAGKLRGRNTAIIATGLLPVAAGLSLTRHVTVLVVAAQVMFLASMLVLSIILGRYLHDALPSSVRAGSSSVVTTLGYLLFLPIGVLFGSVSSSTSVFHGAWIVFALACLASLLLLFAVGPKPRGQQPATDG